MKWSTVRALGEIKYFNVCYLVLIGIPALATFYVGGGFASPEFTVKDLSNPSAYATRLQHEQDSVSALLNSRLTKDGQQMLSAYDGKSVVSTELQSALVLSLNEVVKDTSLYDKQRFPPETLRKETQKWLQRDPKGKDFLRLNRMLLEDAFPYELTRKFWLGGFPSFPFALKLLFLASLFYAVGIAIYQFCCPKTITAYKRDNDYLEAERAIHMVSRPDRDPQIVLTNLLPEQNAIFEQLAELIRLQTVSPNSAQQSQLDAIVEKHKESCVQHFLLNQYAQQDTVRIWLAVICLLFYILGTLIMVWLLIEKCIHVFAA